MKVIKGNHKTSGPEMHWRKVPFKIFQISRAVAQRCSVKNMFLEYLQNSQENTCARLYDDNRVGHSMTSRHHDENSL